MGDEKSLPWGLKSKSLTPGSLKGLTDNKLKAFNIGSMNAAKVLTKKETEEMRRRRNDQETAEVYKEFVETFENSNKGLSKAWVKGGVVTDKEHGKEKSEISNKLYKPVSKFQTPSETSSLKAAIETLPSLRKEDKMVKPASLKKKGLLSAERKKTNLELFKEELKVIQEERSERRKVRIDLGLPPTDTGNTLHAHDNEEIASGFSIGLMPTAEEIGLGFFNYENDTQTTNIYLGNLCPKMTEIQICEIFGHYGPLASVKVMWPRTDEEKSRNRNCGFVAFMNRKDGERALNNLQGKEIMGFEMKLGWGKCVVIPPHPIYIPPALSQLTLPPPPSGLPFNAQPVNQSKDLDKCLVKVVIPTEKTLMCVMHRTIEFVVREGPMFEAMIMNRELHNPLFRFLFENKTPAHIYYRWKLYSILQGDSPCSWKGDEFVMFKGGSTWKPPPKNPFSQGMPDELISGNSTSNNNTTNNSNNSNKRLMLSDRQRDHLEDMLRGLTVERVSVGDCMLWCLKHADFAEEIVDCITQAVCQPDIPPQTSIARLFLISDLLHNSSVRLANASYYRRYFELKLVEIFKSLRASHASINARLKAEQFKQKVMCCFRAWEDWTIYNNDFLINLQNIFLGLVLPKQLQDSDNEGDDDEDEDVDGIPLEELDGLPMAAPTDQADKAKVVTTNPIIPYANDSDGENASEITASSKPSFVPSKWEQVDENELESQAMTVSKWDSLNQTKGIVDYDEEDEEDIDGIPVADLQDNSDREYRSPSDKSKLDKDESKRRKLKEIEMRVLRYQDELEAETGGRDKKVVAEKVDDYRQKLLKREFNSDSSEKSSSKKSEKKKESKKRRREDGDEYRESSRTKESSLVAYNSSNEDSSNSSPQNNRHRKRSVSKSPRRKKSPKHKSSKKNKR